MWWTFGTFYLESKKVLSTKYMECKIKYKKFKLNISKPFTMQIEPYNSKVMFQLFQTCVIFFLLLRFGTTFWMNK